MIRGNALSFLLLVSAERCTSTYVCAYAFFLTFMEGLLFLKCEVFKDELNLFMNDNFFICY